MAEFRLPNITGLSEREQLQQMKSYLFQLVGQLQFVTTNIENEKNASKEQLSQLTSQLTELVGQLQFSTKNIETKINTDMSRLETEIKDDMNNFEAEVSELRRYVSIMSNEIDRINQIIEEIRG